MTSEESLNNSREKLEIEKKIVEIKEKQNSLDADAVGLSSSLVDSIKEIQGISTKRTTFDQNLLKVNKQIAKEILGQKSGLSDISSIQKQIQKNSPLIEKGKRMENALTNSLSDKEKERVKIANAIASNISKEKGIQEQILDKAAKTGKLDEFSLKRSQQKQLGVEGAFNLAIKGLNITAQQAVFTNQHTKELEKHNKEREKEAKTLKENEKKLGAFGGLLKGIGKIPILGDLVDTDEILGSAMGKIKEGGSGVAGLGAGLKTAGKQMLKSITNPANLALFAFTSIVTALIKADSQIVPSFASPSPIRQKTLPGSFLIFLAKASPTQKGNPCPNEPVDSITCLILFDDGCPPSIEFS